MGGFAKQKDGSPGDALVMLERCHERIVENIDILTAAAERWSKNRDPSGLEDAQSVSRFLERTGKRHEADEEESVFPRLPRGQRLDQVIRVLVAEHRDHEREINYLSELVSAKPDPEELTHCASRLRSAYRAHIALEDAEVKPVVRDLAPQALVEIYDEMQDRRGR